MDYVVTVDDRGRVLLPVDVRRRLGLRKGSKLILRVVEGGHLEAIPLERELERVAEVFKKKFAGWREEDHEATSILLGRALAQVIPGGAVEPLVPRDFAVAVELHESRGLDYFDALVAAQCLVRGAKPVTTDAAILKILEKASKEP